MSAMQRNKGVRAEREVESAFRGRGFSTDRNIGGRTQVSGDIATEGIAIEVRRRESLSLDAWSRDHEEQTPSHVTPVVAYRRSKAPWRVSMRLEDFLDLLEEARS